jgi:hypothetical protein
MTQPSPRTPPVDLAVFIGLVLKQRPLLRHVVDARILIGAALSAKQSKN